MSTPTEQARAVIQAEALLRELADPGNVRARMAAFRIPRARAILRHLPTAAEWAALLSVETLRRLEMRDEFARESARFAEELRAKARRTVAKKGKRRAR